MNKIPKDSAQGLITAKPHLKAKSTNGHQHFVFYLQRECNVVLYLLLY